MGKPAIIALASVGSLVWPSFPALAEIEQANVVPPSSPWQLDYQLEACVLSRTFGEGEDRAVLQLEQFRPGLAFRLLVQGKFLRLRGRDLNIDVGFGDEDPVRLPPSAFMARSPGRQPILLAGFHFLPAPPLAGVDRTPARTSEQEKAIDVLTLVQADRWRTVLELGPMDVPMKAMRRCIDDMLQTWGYDPQVYAALSRPPTPKSPPENWIAGTKYPLRMRNEYQESIVTVRLGVDEAGSTTNCTVQNIVGDEAFRSAACNALVENAEFEPALDASGKPVAAPYFASVVWQMAGP